MTARLWSPTQPALHDHPELAHMALLAHQLELLTAALTLAHAGDSQPEPLTDHARGMVQVVRILQLQIDTYRELVSAQPAVASVKKRRGRG